MEAFGPIFPTLVGRFDTWSRDPLGFFRSFS